MSARHNPRDWPAYQDELSRVLSQVSQADVDSFISFIDYAHFYHRTVFVCGNGGSAANASHFAQDLAKGTVSPGGVRLRALSLCDNAAWLTALANDIDYSAVFVEQLVQLAGAWDVLVAISGSGNSPNVVRAVAWGNAHQLKTVAVTGFDGGRLKEIADFTLHVPCHDMGMVEAAHAALFHHTVSRLRRMWAAQARGVGEDG